MTNILTCNPILFNELLENDKIPKQFLTDNYKESYSNYKTNFTITKFFYDRSETIPYYLNVDKTKYPIPDCSNFNLSLNEVVESRAKELLALGKRINVSWSGGIDSTFVLFTLYNLAEDKSQIKVYGTYSSVIESGYMFDKYIRDKIEYDIHVNKPLKNNYICPDDEIFVTGSMGNDIFYPDIIPTARDAWIKFKDPSIHNVKNCATVSYKDILQDCTLEFLDSFIKKAPRKIETLQDLRWWVFFCFNWYSVKNNSYIGLDKSRADKIHAFFGSDDFQRWSMVNKEIVTKTGDYSDERWYLREKITEYTGDSFYSNNKKNTVSVLSSFGKDWLFLKNDYSNIYVKDL